MKLKEINDAIVHCRTKAEAKALIKNVKVEGEEQESWINHFEFYGESTCYRIVKGTVVGYSSIDYYGKNSYKITEFSDFIEPEEKPVLTAEEAIEWIGKHYHDGVFKEVFGCDYEMNALVESMELSEITKRISKWKAEHEKPEKKEPELEWYWEGTIFKKNGMDDCETVAEYDTGCSTLESAEAYMRDALCKYCMEHEGEYIAQVEHVCRVKKS